MNIDNNKNYEKKNCIVCGNAYYIFLGTSRRMMIKNVRTRRAVTCSKECSKNYFKNRYKYVKAGINDKTQLKGESQ